jgi:hypothetical protein
MVARLHLLDTMGAATAPAQGRLDVPGGRA